MRKSAKKWIAVLLALVMMFAMMPAGMVSAAVAGNTYYVSTTPGDSNATQGSEANPFTTIAAGVAVLQPGDTLVIKAGNYAEALDIGGLSGSAVAPITIKGEKGTNVKGSVNVSTFGFKIGLNLAHTQYVNVNNIYFVPGSCSYVFAMYATSNVKLQNCTFDGTNASSSDAKIVETNSNITLDGNYFTTGTSTTFDGYGFTDSTIVNNIFTDWWTFYWSPASLTNSVISNNLFSSTGEAFYGEWSSDGSKHMTGDTITNNIFLGSAAYLDPSKNTCANNSFPSVNNKISDTDIVAAPADMFVSYDTKNWIIDYHLKAGSPCIDAGTKTGLPKLDYEGSLRFGPADIGPYTYANVVYVDAAAQVGGDGKSEATAYNSIAAVVDAKVIVPGVTVMIKPGIYTGNISITGTGAADAKEIAIRKLGDGLVSIDGGSSPAITVTNASNVNISGLTLSSSYASNAPALKLDGAVNCKVFDSTFNTSMFGIEITGNTSGSEFYGNNITGTEKGIYLRDSSNNKIYNNIFYNYKCILNEDGTFTNTTIMNNDFTSHWGDGTIILNGTSANQQGDTGNTIANNIITADCVDPIRLGANESAFYDAASNNIVDYNLYNSNSQAAKPDRETNSVLGDPLFVSASDFHLQLGSAATNRGTSVNAPEFDRDGSIRFGKTDIGAYEYTGDSSAFYIINQTPQGSGVKINAPITLVMSEKASAANNNFTDNIAVTASVDGKDVNVAGTFSTADDAAGGTIIMFTPDKNYYYGTTYTVSVKKELMSDNGNYLPVDTNWKFTTEPFITDSYYIAPNGSDSNLGTIDSPKKTVTKDLIANLKPGDTIYFREGTYNGVIVLQSKAGTADKPITIKNYNNEKVVLTSDHPDYILYLGHCQNINIEGLTFAPNESQNGSRGVSMYIDNHSAGGAQTSNIKITHCTYINCSTAAAFRDLADVGFGNFEFSNNVIYSNDGWGIYFQEVREKEGCYGKIFNNVIYGAHYSVNLWGRSTHLLFYNNTFADTYDAQGGSGRYDIYPVKGSYTPDKNPENISTDLVFKNNIFTKPIRTQLENGKSIIDASQNCVFDNNVYSIAGTDRITWAGGGSGPVLTLAQLQSGTAWEQQGRVLETNGVDGDVTFANVASDARIIFNTNPAIGAAAASIIDGVAAPAADINGRTRANNEAGAYAFDSTFAFVGNNTTGKVDGSPVNPYPSITAAVIAGAKTINMLAGTYTADENIDMAKSTGDGNVIVTPYSGAVTLSGAFSVSGVADKSFTIKNVTLTGDTAISGTNVAVDSNKIDGSVAINNATGVIVTNNVFSPKAADGIALTGSTSCSITNNVITDRQTAVKFTASTNNKIYNNTLYGNTVADVALDADSTGNVLKNNIFSTSVSNRAGNTYDYNLYNSDTMAKTDLDAITAEVEAHAVKATPAFVNEKAGDYRLYKGSACGGAGIMEEGIPAKDINGISRKNPPDIGAYTITAVINNYYVDGTAGSDANAGTEASPFKTIGAAVNAMRNGEGIIVKAGTYNENITIANKAGSTYDDYAIITDGDVVLNGTITVNNSTGVTIDGFTVNAGADKTAITVNGSSFTGIGDMTISDAKVGVNAVASPNLYTIRVNVKNVVNGFVLDGANSESAAVILQSKVDKASAAAIDARNQTVLGLGSSIITNSKEGVYGTGEASFLIVNNTFYNNSGYSIDITQNPGHATQLDILNNIFSRSSRGQGVFNYIDKSTGFYTEYNLYDAAADEAITYFYGGSQNFEETQTNGDETMSVLGDPMFKDPANGDFSLKKGSPAARAGVQEFNWDVLADGSSFTITAPPIDCNGTDFSSHGQDIGALYTPYSLKTYHLAGDGVGLSTDDGADGSAAKPFRNFSDAVNALDSGDTLIVHKGIYFGRNDIDNLHGVADANIIIKADNDPNSDINVKVDPDNSLPGPIFTGKNDWTNKDEKVYNYETMSHITNSSYITIDGLYVTGFHGAGLWADNCEGLTFKNLNIWDIDNPDPHNSGVEGILLGSTSNSLLKDINIWDIGQTIKSQADHGMYCGGLDNVTFDSVKVSNSPGGGFQFYHGDNYNIHSTNVTIKNCVFSETNMGLILCGIDGFKIINNTFYNNWNMDLYLDWNVRNTLFENNLFYNDLADGRNDPTWGNFVTPTVINYQWSTLKENADKTYTEMVVDNTFKNNMYQYTNPKIPAECSIRGDVMPIADFVAYENASDTGNTYTNTFTGSAKFKGTITGVTDEYQKAQLIFDNILDLQGDSDAIDKGTAQDAPAIDILGRTRDSVPDVGAYECPEADKIGSVVVTPPPATITPTPVPTVTPTPTPGAEPQFSDIEGNWAHKAIMDMAKAGVLTGYSDGTARPNANATRAEFVTFITKLMKAESNTAVDFSDINTSAWYMKYLSAAVEKGWIKGRTDGSFAPNSSITREEAFAIISRIIDSLGVASTIDTSALDSYTDKDSISAWAKNDMAKLVGLGIIQGSNSKLNPKAEITRAEICTILDRVMEKYLNK